MKLIPLSRSLVSLVLVLAGAIASAEFVGVHQWAKAATGLFVLLSVVAAALLVRLARPSPFSNPDVFTDENLQPFFAALEQVARRLTVILVAVLIAVVLLIGSLVMADLNSIADPRFSAFVRVGSGLLGLDLSFILVRIVSLVQGDFGFIGLQKRIVVEARHRKARPTCQDR